MWCMGLFWVKNIPYFILRIFLVGRSGWLYVQQEFLFCCTTLSCGGDKRKEFNEVLDLDFPEFFIKERKNSMLSEDLLANGE